MKIIFRHGFVAIFVAGLAAHAVLISGAPVMLTATNMSDKLRQSAVSTDSQRTVNLPVQHVDFEAPLQTDSVKLTRRGRESIAGLGGDLSEVVNGFMSKNRDTNQGHIPAVLGTSPDTANQLNPASSHLIAPPQQERRPRILTAEEQEIVKAGDAQQLAALRSQVWARLTPAQQALIRVRLDSAPVVSAPSYMHTASANPLERHGVSAPEQPRLKRARTDHASSQEDIDALRDQSISASHTRGSPPATLDVALKLSPDAKPTGSLRDLRAQANNMGHSKTGLAEGRLDSFYSEKPKVQNLLLKALHRSVRIARKNRDVARALGQREGEVAWQWKLDADSAAREGVYLRLKGMEAEKAEVQAELEFARLQKQRTPSDAGGTDTEEEARTIPSNASGSSLAGAVRGASDRAWHTSPFATEQDLHDLRFGTQKEQRNAKDRIRRARKKELTKEVPPVKRKKTLHLLKPTSLSLEQPARVSEPRQTVAPSDAASASHAEPQSAHPELQQQPHSPSSSTDSVRIWRTWITEPQAPTASSSQDASSAPR